MRAHRTRSRVAAAVAGLWASAVLVGGCEAVLGLGGLEGGGGSGGQRTTATGKSTTSTSAKTTATTSASGAGMGGSAGSASTTIASSTVSAGGASGHGGTATTTASTTSTTGTTSTGSTTSTGGAGGAATTTASTTSTTASTSGTGGAGGAVDQDAGPPPLGPSCSNGLMCQGISCCASFKVPGGKFQMGRSAGGSDACTQMVDGGPAYDGTLCGDGNDDDQPEHSATIDTYYLDAFEVTVGRYRNFVNQYVGTLPVDGAGAHPQIPGSGWYAATWGANCGLPATQTDLTNTLNCGPNHSLVTWTGSAQANESYAINCVSACMAFAFCIWDGGYLPTEAEWEYAAAGGSDGTYPSGRLFPWGPTDPSVMTALATDIYTGNMPFVPVGSHSMGNGKWGHYDLAGGMGEWVLDAYEAFWYSLGGSTCINCLNPQTATSNGTIRGGAWNGNAENLLATGRVNAGAWYPNGALGFRCARPGT